MSTFVLVHGGLHGSWCWQRVVEPLRAAGHAVDAIDLPGRHGVAASNFEGYVDVVAAAVEAAEPPVTLVAHSVGGVVVSSFAARRPEAIAQLVLVNALLVDDGEAAFAKLQTAGDDRALMRPGVLALSEDGATVMLSAEDARDVFYNCCDPEDVSWAAARLYPEPLAPLMQPVHVAPDGVGGRAQDLFRRTRRPRPAVVAPTADE